MKRYILLVLVLQVALLGAISTPLWGRERQDVGKLDLMLHERFKEDEHALDLHCVTDLAVSVTVGNKDITTNPTLTPGEHTIKITIKNNANLNICTSPQIDPEIYIDEARVAGTPLLPCIAPGSTGSTETKASFSEGTHSLRVIVRLPKDDPEGHVHYKDPNMSNNGVRGVVTFKALEVIPSKPAVKQSRPSQKK